MYHYENAVFSCFIPSVHGLHPLKEEKKRVSKERFITYKPQELKWDPKLFLPKDPWPPKPVTFTVCIIHCFLLFVFCLSYSTVFQEQPVNAFNEEICLLKWFRARQVICQEEIWETSVMGKNIFTFLSETPPLPTEVEICRNDIASGIARGCGLLQVMCMWCACDTTTGQKHFKS